jgi:hypothetical protein
MHELTQERLKELLSYDPATGEFRCIEARGNLKSGSVAGCVWANRAGHQYRHIKINRRAYGAHRLAWLYVHGRWPPAHIDHVDGNGLNNSIANLREATHAENQHNRGAKANNTSGFKGVCWAKRSGKWVATITVGRRQRHLGFFDDPAEAHAAYCAAAGEMHGEFARVA